MTKNEVGNIIFISALDFKEKSIQVIRKTPEAYVKLGWDVRYIVARDGSVRGNYSYENEFDPSGVRVERFKWPFERARNYVRSRWLSYFLTKAAGAIVIFQLAIRAAKCIRDEPATVIYGYEVHGVLAARLARFLGTAKTAAFVTRFQGTWLVEFIEKKQWLRLFANFGHVVALRTKCDLCIMTDDGTRGNRAIKLVRSPAIKNFRFWVNGTDIPDGILERNVARFKLGIPITATVMVSVSRLEPWKRVDRGIALTAQLHSMGLRVIYVIVGGGAERQRLEKAAADAGVTEYVKFVGAVAQQEVFSYMNAADLFISMYDLSNVGNPLLEAIRLGKIIVTLNNGDTGSWISHGHTGLIYDVAPNLISRASSDIMRVVEDTAWRETLESGVQALAEQRLWTWEERLSKEVADVSQLIKS